MDFFTRLEKRAMSLTPRTEEFDRFVAGIAVALDSEEAGVETALLNHGSIEDKDELFDYYSEELFQDIQHYDIQPLEAVELTLFLYCSVVMNYFSMYSGYEDLAAFKKAMMVHYTTVFDEYAELYNIEDALLAANMPDNVIAFPGGK